MCRFMSMYVLLNNMLYLYRISKQQKGRYKTKSHTDILAITTSYHSVQVCPVAKEIYEINDNTSVIEHK